MKPYTKPPLTIDQQIELLKSRGLAITDKEKAGIILKQINYYRLSAYCLPFERTRHVFKDDITLENIKDLYEFDRCLRFLIDEALEVIETSLRSTIAYYLSHTHGAFAHENSLIFYNANTPKGFNHKVWISQVHEEIERSKETFVQHYKHTYENFPAIPIWMAVEVMSFGSLSKIFHNLKKSDQINIAKNYNLNHRVLASWLHTFTYVRNICAHHSRLWNKELSIAMEVPGSVDWSNINSKRIVSVLYAINYVFKALAIDNEISKTWRKEIAAHLGMAIKITNFLNVIGAMDDFVSNPLWK